MTVLPAPSKPRSRLGAIFLAPAVLALVSLAGLVSALVGDELWDIASWLALAVPIAVAGWYVLRRRARKP